MEHIKFILRFAGLLFIPLIILLLGTIIGQNSAIYIDDFSLLGGWWQLHDLPLSSLLICFLLLGAMLVFSLILLLKSERRLRHELSELRQMNKQEAAVQTDKNSPRKNSRSHSLKALKKKNEEAKPGRNQDNGSPA